MGARNIPRYVFPRDSGSFVILVATSIFKGADIYFLKNCSSFGDCFD